MLDRLRDAWRRYGLLGTAAHIWARTFGLIFDVNVVYSMRTRDLAGFERAPGFRYERVPSSSPRFDEAAALLRVDPSKRRNQEVFIAVSEADDRIAACVFNDLLTSQCGEVRGLVVSPRHRGHALGPGMLRYQAQELARDGATEVQSHVSLMNRASRRMLERLGYRYVDQWVFLVALRRFRVAFKTRDFDRAAANAIESGA